MDKLIHNMIRQMQVLDGDIVGSGKGSWQDEAKLLSTTFRKLAIRMDNLANGEGGPFVSFAFGDDIRKALDD